eukprot:1312736-Amphidinium_carterae.1
MAGQVPVGDTESDDIMDIGEPDNPMAITELVAHLREMSSSTRRQVDVLGINLQKQQLDVTHEEQYASRLHLEYSQAIQAMEAALFCNQCRIWYSWNTKPLGPGTTSHSVATQTMEGQCKTRHHKMQRQMMSTTREKTH